MVANDPQKARLIWAKSPSDKEECIRLAVQSKTTRLLVEGGRLDAMGEYMGLILLEGVLQDPVSIFQGIKRPYFSDGLDNFVFAYHCCPIISYTYYESDRFKGTGPHEIAAPSNRSVFTVFVSLARPVVEDALKEIGPEDREMIRGVILGWEWTKAAVDNPRMPNLFSSRYRRRVWP